MLHISRQTLLQESIDPEALQSTLPEHTKQQEYRDGKASQKWKVSFVSIAREFR